MQTIINKGVKMNTIFSLKETVIQILLIVSFGAFSLAEEALPTSNKKSDIELPTSTQQETSSETTISLEISEPSTSSKLKKGKGCVNVKGLKEAEGEEFIDFPMAETIPCDEVDCKNLDEAELHDNKYEDLPEADSVVSCEE